MRGQIGPSAKVRDALRIRWPLANIAIIDIGNPTPVCEPAIRPGVGIDHDLEGMVVIEPVIPVENNNHIFGLGLAPVNGTH